MSLPRILRDGDVKLGLGGAPLGNLYAAVTDSAANAVIEAAYAGGIRYFDTAPHYGQGLSERRFGAALRGCPRRDYQISTKVGRILEAAPSAPRAQHGYVDVPPLFTRYDYTAAGIERSLADSCTRLGMDRVDIVYVHDLDPATHGEEFTRHFADLIDSGLPGLLRLKAAGAIGAVGIGVNGVDIALKTLRAAPLDVLLLAGRYTLADTTALAILLPECARRDVDVVLGGVFNAGILATGTIPADGSAPMFDYAPATPEVIAQVAAIEALCAKHTVALPAAALQFTTAHPGIDITLIGVRSVEELTACLAWQNRPIPLAFWRDLRRSGQVDAAAPLPGLH